MQTIEIIYPDDWHCHLRDGEALKTTVPLAAKQFKRVIVMPNLQPAVITAMDAMAYLSRIKSHLPKGADFEPLMTLYLTDATSKNIIQEIKDSGFVTACKLYPAGVTTNATQGVNSLEALYPVFEAMEKVQLPLLIHGEVNDKTVDIFDREKIFIERYGKALMSTFPGLKIVFEHITTIEAVDFVKAAPKTVAATLTPQHLLLNRNALFMGGIKPHHYCLPVLKRSAHQEALIQAATSGNPKFFIGTDSAPHAKSKKESACGCAGIFSHHAAIELYASVFEQANALEKLEGFTSIYGPQFYNLPINKSKIRLVKENWMVPKTLDFENETLIPFYAGESLTWKVMHDA